MPQDWFAENAPTQSGGDDWFAANAPAAPPEQNSISAKPSGAGQWLRDLEADVRYGGTTTLPGRILNKLGAPGLNVGSQGNAETPLQTTPLGPIHVAQGVAEKRPLHALKGALETVEIPSAFVGGPAASKTLEATAEIVSRVRPSATLTKRMIASVEKVANHEGIAVTGKTPVEKLTSLSNGFVTRAKTVYQQLDKAADGNLQPLLDTIEETKHAIQAQKNLDPEKAAKLAKELARLEGQKAITIARLTKNGVADAEKLLREADRNYARGKQIERLAKKAHTHSGKAQYGGKVNPEKFARSLDTDKTIAQVEGGLGKQTMQEFTSAAQNALKTKKRLKYATGGAAVVGGGYATKTALGRLSGE